MPASTHALHSRSGAGGFSPYHVPTAARGRRFHVTDAQVVETEDDVFSTHPGGRLAPPPPVTRVAAGGAVFLVASFFAFVWAGLSTLHKVTAREHAVPIIARMLEEPYRVALRDGLRTQRGSPIIVQTDLIDIEVDRNAAGDINIHQQLAVQRAEELYDGGYPVVDSPRTRTTTAFPRSLISVFSADRHKNLGTATTAALVGMATTFFLCAVIATGASRFLLPGAAALVGYIILEYHLRLLKFWFAPGTAGGDAVRGRVNRVSVNPTRDLLFVTIALLVAGLVFRALRGPLRSVTRAGDTREAREAESPAVQPAGEPSK